MEFCRKRVSGHVPQCGAIFMADNSTRKECFQRKIFGLPFNFGNFVMKVKIGMLLFLFDYEERKLYGVFEATSDGAMNIIPHAYKSSTKKFPAQVSFSIIWRCAPVPEEAFRDAIGENYFAPHKFNFGLSRDQVQKLLVLFRSRRIETRISRDVIWKKKWQIRWNAMNSEVERKLDSEDKSEISSEKPACSAISDNGSASELDGYKPVPSDLDGVDFIPLPSMDVEDTMDPLPDGCVEDPLNSAASQKECDALQLAIDALFSEVGVCPAVKEKPGPQHDEKAEGTTQTDSDCDYHVNGLYSDTQERKSVFLRLNGVSRVTKQDTYHHCDGTDNSRGILRLEGKQRMRKKESNSYHEPKTPKNGNTVFSRLSYNVKQAPRKQPSERIAASENRCLTMSEKFPHKRKYHTMKTLCEVQENKSDPNNRMRTNEHSQERKISACSPTELVLSLGTSASSVSCGSCDAAFKNRNIEIPAEESQFDCLTATETMVEFQPCPSQSFVPQEPPEKATVSTQVTDVSLKPSVDVAREAELEYLPGNITANTEVG